MNTQDIVSGVKEFAKENKKQIIWLLITAIAAWFIIELISNWAAFASGFQEGLNQ